MHMHTRVLYAQIESNLIFHSEIGHGLRFEIIGLTSLWSVSSNEKQAYWKDELN